MVFEKGSNQSSISIFFSKVKCGQNSSSQSMFECLKVPLCVMLQENLGHSDSLRLLLILAHDFPSYLGVSIYVNKISTSCKNPLFDRTHILVKSTFFEY